LEENTLRYCGRSGDKVFLAVSAGSRQLRYLRRNPTDGRCCAGVWRTNEGWGEPSPELKLPTDAVERSDADAGVCIADWMTHVVPRTLDTL